MDPSQSDTSPNDAAPTTLPMHQPSKRIERFEPMSPATRADLPRRKVSPRRVSPKRHQPPRTVLMTGSLSSKVANLSLDDEDDDVTRTTAYSFSTMSSSALSSQFPSIGQMEDEDVSKPQSTSSINSSQSRLSLRALDRVSRSQKRRAARRNKSIDSTDSLATTGTSDSLSPPRPTSRKQVTCGSVSPARQRSPAPRLSPARRSLRSQQPHQSLASSITSMGTAPTSVRSQLTSSIISVDPNPPISARSQLTSSIVSVDPNPPISARSQLTSSITSISTLPPSSSRSQFTSSITSNMTSSIISQNGSIMLAPELLLLDEEEDSQRVGDDLVGRPTSVISRPPSIVARSRDSTAGSRDSVASAKPPPSEYRRSEVEDKQEQRQQLPPGEENQPGAFSIPRRALGGVPAWFEEALQRRRAQQEQQEQERVMRRGSSARSNHNGSARSLSFRDLLGSSSPANNSSGRRLSLQNLREGSLQVFARLCDSGRTNGSHSERTEDASWRHDATASPPASPRSPKSPLAARPVIRRWSSSMLNTSSSVLDATCMNLATPTNQDHTNQRQANNNDEGSIPLAPPATPRQQQQQHSTSRSKVLSPVLKKIVTTPIQLFKKRKRPVRRAQSVDL